MLFYLCFYFRLKAGADPNVIDETGAKPGDVFHDGVNMSQRFEIKKLIRQRYNLMGETCVQQYLVVLGIVPALFVISDTS